jgi:phage terminase small subunit
MEKRLTPMQMRFAKEHARTGDPHYAAWKAGYAHPIESGNALKHNMIVQDRIRAETQRFLFERAGALSTNVLVEVAADPNQPVGARVKAAAELAKLANIAITDAAREKPASELSAGELGALVEEMRHELVKQQAIVQNALTSLPTTVIDNDYFDDDDTNDVFA